MRSYLVILPVFVATVEGFSREQQLNNSGFVSVRVRKLERFKHTLVVRDVTTSVAHLRICASAPSLFASVSVSEVLGCGESPCRSQWDFDRSRRVFTHNSFECVSQFLCSQPCHGGHLITFPTHSRWLKISSWRKNALQKER